MNLPPVIVEIIVLVLLEIWLWVFLTGNKDERKR